MSVSRGADDTTRDEDVLIEQLLVRATNDWLSARDFLEVAARSASAVGPGTDAELAADLAASMVREGLVLPGDIVRSRHVPWACSLEESIARVADHWRADPSGALTDGYVWFHASPAALERARARGAADLDPVGLWSYPGHWVERPDGVKVGLRHASACGGAVIDVLYPDGTEEKVVTR